MNHRDKAAIRFEPEEESTKISECLLKKTTGRAPLVTHVTAQAGSAWERGYGLPAIFPGRSRLK